MDTKQRLVQLADGSYVERDVYGIVERIRQYDPNLRIKYLRADQMSVGDAPYAIFEVCPDGLERLVFTVWELNASVLERLAASDTHKKDVLASIDKNNFNAREALRRRYKEEGEEVLDMIRHVYKSPKGTYSFNYGGKHIKIDDDPARKATITKVD